MMNAKDKKKAISSLKRLRWGIIFDSIIIAGAYFFADFRETALLCLSLSIVGMLVDFLLYEKIK